MKLKLQTLTLTLTLASAVTISIASACLAEAPVPASAATVPSNATALQSATTPLPPTAAQRAARPRQALVPNAANPATAANPPAADDKSTTTADAPKFVSEAKWILAGYNNDELVYTVIVTNQDSHIIRCTTEVNGFYFEDGNKLTISDRQITTVFPNQPTQTGYWMDMDKDSGATYAVKCKAV